MKPKIVYECDPYSVSGYARAARNHMRALIENGVDILIHSRRKDNVSVQVDSFWAKEMPNRVCISPFDHTDYDLKIWHETPEFYDPVANKKNIALLAWETSKIPNTDIDGEPRKNWVKQLNKMDQVWVPCTHNKRVLEESGVTVPVFVVPHPVLESDLDQSVQAISAPEPAFLNLVSVFQWQPRKGPIELVLSILNSKDPIRLALKTYGSYPNADNEHQQITHSMRLLKNSYHSTPVSKILFSFNTIADNAMPSIYKSGEAYISTSRGEGFNLPAVEAMLCGLPIIVPNHSSFSDFLVADVGYALPYIEEPVHGMGHIPWYSPDQTWGRVDTIKAQEVLHAVHTDKKSGVLAQKGANARKFAQENFNTKKIGILMKRLIQQCLGEVV